MQKGFTLIELMIVVTIIGILTSISIPAYQNYITRSQVSEALVLSSQYKISISNIYSQSSVCPTLVEMGLTSPTDGGGRYVYSVSPFTQIGSICAIEFTFKSSGISKELQSKHLVFALISQTADLGASSWSCTSTDIAQKYLPKVCTGI